MYYRSVIFFSLSNAKCQMKTLIVKTLLIYLNDLVQHQMFSMKFFFCYLEGEKSKLKKNEDSRIIRDTYLFLD